MTTNQDVGKVRRIEEDDRNGGTGADSSEDARGMEGFDGRRLSGDGTGDCRIGGIDEKQRTHISSLCMAQTLFSRAAKCCRCSPCHRKVFWNCMA